MLVCVCPAFTILLAWFMYSIASTVISACDCLDSWVPNQNTILNFQIHWATVPICAALLVSKVGMQFHCFHNYLSIETGITVSPNSMMYTTRVSVTSVRAPILPPWSLWLFKFCAQCILLSCFNQQIYQMYNSIFLLSTFHRLSFRVEIIDHFKQSQMLFETVVLPLFHALQWTENFSFFQHLLYDHQEEEGNLKDVIKNQ